MEEEIGVLAQPPETGFIRHVAQNGLDAVGAECRPIRFASNQNANRIPPGLQRFNETTADETGRTGNRDARHAGG